LSKFKREPPGTEVAAKLLPEQRFDIGFVIDDQNKQIHRRTP
jgi:hypothetical protein